MINKPTTYNRPPTARMLGFYILLLVVSCWSLVGTPIPAFAQAEPTPYRLLEPLPFITGPDNQTTTAPTFIEGLFKLMIAIATALAVVTLIYGGFTYISTDAFGTKSAAKGIIENALWGLFLALGAYMILFTISPTLLDFDVRIPTTPLPSGNATSTDGGGGGSPGPLTQTEVMQQLDQGRITIRPRTLRLDGLRQSTINEIVGLKNQCPTCVIALTSATGGSHATTGTCNHRNGYKADLGLSPSLTSHITRNYTRLPQNRTSDNAPLYRSPSGALYAQESDHWDVAVCR